MMVRRELRQHGEYDYRKNVRAVRACDPQEWNPMTGLSAFSPRAANGHMDCGAAEQRDELASSCVEHGASSPLWTGGISNDHQPANGPCSRFSAPQPTTEDN